MIYDRCRKMRRNLINGLDNIDNNKQLPGKFNK